LLVYILIVVLGQANTVDDAIDLYLMGDMNGAISALESMLDNGNLTPDEQVRAYHRLGAAYFGIGRRDETESAFYNLLVLDPYYDLGPWENPELRRILNDVRQENLATVLIQGEPEGALVFMDGEYLGTTPYIHDNLMGGKSYDFTIMADGYKTTVQTCRATPGELQTMNYSLDPMSALETVAMSDSATMLSSGSETVAGLPLQADTTSDGSEDEFSIEQLGAILSGGEEMSSISEMGPLNHSSENESVTPMGGSERDLTRFRDIDDTIDLGSESHAQMVFSSVNIEEGNVLQTDPGSSYSSRTAQEVREVLASKESAVTFIYNKHLRSDPMLSGTVVIQMVIQPSGRVSDVSIVDSNTMNPAFDLELASTVATWRFGAVDEDEGPLPVTYPFSFSR
jgi:TonB family protein